jgi:CubicO group peptidase (beta-lactamase class C family)
MKIAVLSAALASLLAMGAATAADAPDASTVRAALDALAADTGGADAPGCAIAVYRDGKLDSLHASAMANLETSTPLDGDSLFYAASVSKQFTALAVMVLAGQGKLSLDDDIRTHIPELPAYAQPITVRMLLQHSSGVLDSLSLLALAGQPQASQATMQEALALVLKQPQTNFTPGTEVTYSNGAYLLLAELVHRRSGERFADFVKTQVLDPMGMRDSYVLDGKAPTSAHLAQGYVPHGDGYAIRNTYPRFGGSGGLMVTLNDLARYEYDIEHGHRVWTPRVRAEMERPGVLGDGAPARDSADDLTYASGLQVGRRQGRDVVQHGGGAEAFKHMYVRVPARKLGVAAFCNRGDIVSQDVADDALDALLGPAPGYVPPAPAAGRYRAQSLDADYIVSRRGERLLIDIVPAQAQAPTHSIELRRNASGDYSGDGATLKPLDGEDGFTLGNSRARGLRVLPAR